MCFLFMKCFGSSSLAEKLAAAGEQIEDDGVSDSEVLLRGLDLRAFRAQSVYCAD